MASQHALKITDKVLILRTNFGDDSIALVQYIYEIDLAAKACDIRVAYIETGWEAEAWLQRIEEGEAHVKRCGFKVERIKAQIPFHEAVKGRNAFPSFKFQWCSGLLKGLPFLDWLDSIDLRAKAIIAIAKRKSATSEARHANSQSSINSKIELNPWIEACEFHQGRSVWHPLLELSMNERDALLSRAGFTPLGHRSLECHPCVNSTLFDFSLLKERDMKKVEALEEDLGHSFFSRGIRAVVNLSLRWRTRKSKPSNSKDYLSNFYRGCGNHFGCGL